MIYNITFNLIVDVKIQLYADDVVLYVRVKTKQEPAAVLSAAMIAVSDWLKKFLFAY